MLKMKKVVNQLKFTLYAVLSTLVVTKSMAQNTCQVVGWATQNGGTTGGGFSNPTIVTSYNQLNAAITSTSVKVVRIEGTIEIPSGGHMNMVDQSGKTVYGMPNAKLVTNDQTKDHSGIFTVKNCKNMIFQNL